MKISLVTMDLPLPVHNLVLSFSTVTWLLYEVDSAIGTVPWRLLGMLHWCIVQAVAERLEEGSGILQEPRSGRKD